MKTRQICSDIPNVRFSIYENKSGLKNNKHIVQIDGQMKMNLLPHLTTTKNIQSTRNTTNN